MAAEFPARSHKVSHAFRRPNPQPTRLTQTGGELEQ